MTIKNLTPHSIVIVAPSCATPTKGGKFEADPNSLEIVRTFPSEGIARVSSSTLDAAPIDGVPTVEVAFGDPVDLPAPQEGVYLIVSGLLAACPSLKGRSDLLTPAKQVVSKDNPSQVLGCLALARA